MSLRTSLSLMAGRPKSVNEITDSGAYLRLALNSAEGSYNTHDTRLSHFSYACHIHIKLQRISHINENRISELSNIHLERQGSQR